MRKYVLILILVIVAILCINLVVFGFKIGKFKINSYNDISRLSIEKNELLSDLNKKNTTEFKDKINELKKSTDNYKIVKTQYDELVESGEISESAIYSSMDIYNLDFLWTTIGNYATEKGVTLQFDITRSSSATSLSSDCIMCDLNFIITGDYIAITDFVYSLEDDDKLNFEIRDFLVEKGGENLQATFVVKGIPINSQNLSSVPVSSTTYVEE
jgi:hypothetical protein